MKVRLPGCRSTPHPAVPGAKSPLLRVGAALLLPIAALAPRAAAQAPPERQVVEVVRIGAWDGPESLTLIRDLVVVPGGVAVSQSMDGAIRVLGASGGVVRTLGRKGDGPGEFQRIDDLGFIDGQLAAVDLGARRRTFFDWATGEVETLPLPQPPISPPALWIGKAYATADRTAIISASVPYDELPLLPIVLARSSTEVLDTIAWFDQRPFGFRIGDGRGRVAARHPLYPEERTSVSPDGRHFVRLIETEDGATLEWYEPATGQRRERHLDLPQMAVPPAWTDSVHSLVYDRVRATGVRTTMRDVRDAIPIPDSVSDIEVVQAVNGEGVWLGGRSFFQPLRTWRYVGPTGRDEFIVRVPRSLRIFDQSGDTLWARDIDDLGVNYVVGLRLSG